MCILYRLPSVVGAWLVSRPGSRLIFSVADIRCMGNTPTIISARESQPVQQAGKEVDLQLVVARIPHSLNTLKQGYFASGRVLFSRERSAVSAKTLLPYVRTSAGKNMLIKRKMFTSLRRFWALPRLKINERTWKIYETT